MLGRHLFADPPAHIEGLLERVASELHLERFKAFKGTRDPNKDRVSVAINDLGALEMGLKRLLKPLRWP